MRTCAVKPKLLVGVLLIGVTLALVMSKLFNKMRGGRLKGDYGKGAVRSETAIELEEKLRRGEKIEENSRKLSELIRFKYIEPFKPNLPYNLQDSKRKDFSRGQSKFIEETLNLKKNGFFIDIGAGDGESESVSLYFEREHNWRGLLIDPDPDKQQEMIVKNRKADILHGCVNDEKFAAQRKFLGSKMLTNMAPDVERSGQTAYSVMCFPFLAILSAIGRRQVDVLTIDVNGRELDILKTIPFILMDIDIVSVEFEEGITNDLLNFMKSQGYRAINLMDNRIVKKRDIIFRRGSGLL